MELTGKSQSVVYSWLNLSKSDFPTIESLGKILFRLGISLDDFMNCRHPVYDNGVSARIYYRYVYGAFDHSYMSSEILELPNAEEVIKTYLYDRMRLNHMIDDSVNGLEIDLHTFDLLCKALMPVFITDIITDANQAVYPLQSDTVNDYKLGIEEIRELEEAYDGEPDFDMPEHYIRYPNANYLILLAADNSPSFLNEYLAMIDDCEKNSLLDYYLKICADCPDYDKKNKIVKQLIEQNCTMSDSPDQDIKAKYCALLKRVLKV